MLAFKTLFKGYRGGFDSKLARRHDFHVGSSQLSIEVPDSFARLKPSTKIISFPINDDAWFESNKKQLHYRHYVPVINRTWYFLPLVQTPFSAELGTLLLSVSIEKRPDKCSKNILNPDEFGELLLDEYMNFYNSPTVGGVPLGWNTDIRNKAAQQSSEMCIPFSDEELKDVIANRIKQYGFPDIKEYSIHNINQKTWVFISILKEI